MNRTILAVLSALFLASAALAQDSATEETPDPIEIIKKVDAAVKGIEAVAYAAKSTPTGIAENFVQPAVGKAVMVGWLDEWNMPQKFFVHVKTGKQGSDEPLELTGGGDGETFFVIDHSTKKGYEDMDPAVMGTAGNTLQAFGMREFVHSRPFDDELNAPTVEYRGMESVNGDECHKIFIDYGQGNQTTTWFFDAETYLPRRRVQHFSLGEQGEGTFAIEITQLEVNPEIDATAFRMKLPEGYEQVDDFAP